MENTTAMQMRAELLYPDKKQLFREMLELMEFRLIEENGEYRLEDLQGGNLGNIEGRRYSSKEEILADLDIYIDDYIVRALEEDLGLCCDSSYEDF